MHPTRLHPILGPPANIHHLTGLTDDDEDLHKDRLKLWQDFNHAWIALIFKQKQYMLRELGDTIVLQPLSLRIVKRMGDELIRLCDGIERHGLVDYQFGVWEDEIESCKCKRH